MVLLRSKSILVWRMNHFRHEDYVNLHANMNTSIVWPVEHSIKTGITVYGTISLRKQALTSPPKTDLYTHVHEY